MNKKELVMSILEKMGYAPEMDDGDIRVFYQMKHIYVFIADDDEPYICMSLPQFHDVEEEKTIEMLITCNKLTREIKVAKVFIDKNMETVSACCEFYFANEEDLEVNMRNAMGVFGIIRTVFKKELADLTSEDN